MPDRYRQLFLAFADAVLITDAAGVIREANTAAAWLLGSPAQALAGHDMREFLAPENVEPFNAQWQTLKSYERLQAETKCRNAARAVVPVSLDIFPLPAKTTAGTAEELYIVVARQPAPHDDRDREAWFQRQTALRGLADPVATFLIAAGAAPVAYPAPQAGDPPRPLDWFAATLSTARMKRPLERAWAGEEVALPPAWFPTGGASDGAGADAARERWLRVAIVPVRMQDAGVTALCVRVTDETARRVRHEEERWMDQQRCRDLLAESFYHDLNNQLSVILAQASGLKLAAPPGQLAPPAVGAIIDAAQQAASLLRGAAAQHRHGGAGDPPQPVDLNVLLPDCAAVLAHRAGGRLTVAVELGRGVPPVAGKADLLRAMVLALGRHIQALIPAGGRLVLKTFRLHAGVAGLPASAGLSVGEDIVAARGARVALADGVGPSADVALARAIVRAHHGRCESISSTTQGTFWEVTLPGMPDEPAAEPPMETPAVAPTGEEVPIVPVTQDGVAAPCRILLADDEENFRMFMSWALRERGFEVVTARDGQEAFERFQEAPESFGLVILDAYMPRMGGLEAYLRMQVVRAELPVLFASGFARGASVDALISGCPGPATVLLKPFSAEDLLVAVRKALAPR